MKKFEIIQLHKLISSYGGVGSIIETNTNGSLLIMPYDNWECYIPHRRNNNPTFIELTDERLRNYVQANGYGAVKRLVHIPIESINSPYYVTETDKYKTVSTERFPSWYYCNNCHQLFSLSTWENKWAQQFPEDNMFKDNEPACYKCSEKRGSKISRNKLEQVRFVMASLETGDIKDIPFNHLFSSDPDDNNIWNIDKTKPVRDLEYKSGNYGDGLNTISIICKDTGRERAISMAKIARSYIIYHRKAYKVQMRGSQSLYLPKIVRTLYIPIKNGDNCTDETEMDLQEFRYLSDDENFKNGICIDDSMMLVARRKPELSYNRVSPFITRITAIERLKEDSVLMYYTRIGVAGEQREWYDVESGSIKHDIMPMLKKPFDNPDDYKRDWMPAVEAYGEGIFFEANVNDLPDEHRELFIHTLCHIIMKEMEFQCGYPLTSLKEKIYVDNDNGKAGFIIYTVAGSEGSYGGLVSLTNDDTIIDLINYGCERAKNCPNDPICISDDLHHCYACLDLPETSCCKFNNMLDRKIFLDYWKYEDEEPEKSKEPEKAEDSEESGERPSGLVL